MFTGLGLPATNSGSSHLNLPILVRFSDRSLLRAADGRPGKRAFATPWALNAALLAGEDGDISPPEAAIIYDNNTDGARAGRWQQLRESQDGLRGGEGAR